MNYKEIFEAELLKNNIKWCLGCEHRRSHKRGFASVYGEKIVHLDNKIVTRTGLYKAFHELGHCLDADVLKRRSFEREQIAEDFARMKMKEYNIPSPRKMVILGNSYIQRKKRHGDNINMGR
jgi:hypothetical protein